MAEFNFRFPSPPPASPSTRSTLGMALALNVLLAAGVHLALAFGHGVGVHEDLAMAALRAAPVIYLTLLLPIVATYGLAAAAWTGWSWWRVPIATLAGAILALGTNAWAMAQWIARHGWAVDPLLSASDARVGHLLGLAAFSLLVLLGVGLSLWPRWLRDD